MVTQGVPAPALTHKRGWEDSNAQPVMGQVGMRCTERGRLSTGRSARGGGPLCTDHLDSDLRE